MEGNFANIGEIHPPHIAELSGNPTIGLRDAENYDVPYIVDLASEAIPQVSTYANVKMLPERMRTFIQGNLGHPDFYCRVVESDMEVEPVGCAIGYIDQYVFSEDRFALDVLFYLKKDWRRVKAFEAMCEDFVDWSKEQGVKQIFMNNTSGKFIKAHARFLRRFGFNVVGIGLVKEII